MSNIIAIDSVYVIWVDNINMSSPCRGTANETGLGFCFRWSQPFRLPNLISKCVWTVERKICTSCISLISCMYGYQSKVVRRGSVDHDFFGVLFVLCLDHTSSSSTTTPEISRSIRPVVKLLVTKLNKTGKWKSSRRALWIWVRDYIGNLLDGKRKEGTVEEKMQETRQNWGKYTTFYADHLA